MVLEHCMKLTIYVTRKNNKDTGAFVSFDFAVKVTLIFFLLRLLAILFVQSYLGLSEETRKMLRKKTNIIFHLAATIQFDDPLKKTILLNVRGTKYMLDFAKECRKLSVFNHTSTAYCHLHEKVLYEKAYLPPADPHMIIKLVEWIDEKITDSITEQILDGYPNTYAFTKPLGEVLVNDEMDNLLVIILRPSVVIPIGLLIAAGKGVLRTMYLSWQEIIKMGRQIIETKLPLNGVVWYPGGPMKRSRLLHYICMVLFHYIPAIFLDSLTFLSENKPDFNNDGSLNARELMTDLEIQLYKVDGQSIDMDEYFYQSTHVARLYALKEGDEIMWCLDRFCILMFLLSMFKNNLHYCSYMYIKNIIVYRFWDNVETRTLSQVFCKYNITSRTERESMYFEKPAEPC
ncbi:hypothetical protein RN001_013345 [Aquatica leii]|uniref:Fatty acyl-CoA reductase n=1 Tax=Aquatica leii TaxID=1421715 RepID=A0AAN7NWA3_9COLE|nr:hypothetical protein RN001_013345 [Aquatica leii]